MKSPCDLTLLVLGAGGAIGSVTVAQAVQAGFMVHAAVRPKVSRCRLPILKGSLIHEVDITDTASIRALLLKVCPTAIVMAAVPPSHPGPTKSERELYLQSILAMQFSLFEALELSSCQASLVLIGSSTVYGPNVVRDTLARMQPQNMRGVAKAAEWILAQQLAAEQDRPLIELRVFCAYGRWMRRDRLLTMALQAALTGGKVRLASTPLPRDWIHHEDIGRAVINAVLSTSQRDSPHVINLCSGELVDCHDVLRRLEMICGRSLLDPTPFPGKDRMGVVLPGIPPSEQDLPGWSIHVDLDSGLLDLWGWAVSGEGQRFLLDEANVR